MLYHFLNFHQYFKNLPVLADVWWLFSMVLVFSPRCSEVECLSGARCYLHDLLERAALALHSGVPFLLFSREDMHELVHTGYIPPMHTGCVRWGYKPYVR
jgi:hypothetical protein